MQLANIESKDLTVVENSITDDIFELASFCLLGIENEVLYEYKKPGNFPHDEFHIVIQMEADLYRFKAKEEGEESLDIFSYDIENNNFHIMDIDGKMIYSTPYVKGLDKKALVKAVETYLSRFTITKMPETFKNGMGKDVKIEDYKKMIRKEQSIFTMIHSEFNEELRGNLEESIVDAFKEAKTKKCLKQSYVDLLKLYHPDRIAITMISPEKADYCTKIIIEKYKVYLTRF